MYQDGSVRVGRVNLVSLARINFANLSNDLADELVLLVLKEHDCHVELDRFGQGGHEVVSPLHILGSAELLSHALHHIAECLLLKLGLNEVTLDGSDRDFLKVGQLLDLVLLECPEVSVEASRCLRYLRHQPLLLLLHSAILCRL